jgi:hypothetical protein
MTPAAQRHQTLARARAAALAECAARPWVIPWRWMGLGLVGAGALVAWGVAAALGASWPGGVVPALTLALLAGTHALALWLALAPRRTPGRWLLIVSVGILAMAAVIFTSNDHPHLPFTTKGASCGMLELALSVVPAALGLLALRFAAPSPMRAAMVGLGSGAVGVFVLYLECSPNAAHVGLFHVVPWLFVVGISVALQRVIPPRSYAP